MTAKAKYRAITKQISVTASPTYLEDQSAPEDNHFVWAYHVVIEYRGRETVQLQSRHWRITNARGEVSEVRGLGVVGEQPRLEPGEGDLSPFLACDPIPIARPLAGAPQLDVAIAGSSGDFLGTLRGLNDAVSFI
jgi:hypothetical protein